jgi:energy-converting hydrogenase Eha subunit H
MADWIGLLFFVLLVVGIFVGLKILSRPEKRTEADFERNAAKSASMLGIGMSAL